MWVDSVFFYIRSTQCTVKLYVSDLPRYSQRGLLAVMKSLPLLCWRITNTYWFLLFLFPYWFRSQKRKKKKKSKENISKQTIALMLFPYLCGKKKGRHNYSVELCVAETVSFISVLFILDIKTQYIWQLWSPASYTAPWPAVLSWITDLLLLFCRTVLQKQVIFVLSSAQLITMSSIRDSFTSGFLSLTILTTHARWSARPEEQLWL